VIRDGVHDGHHQLTAGPQHAADFPQACRYVFDVHQHVVRDGQVEVVVLERQRRRVGNRIGVRLGGCHRKPGARAAADGACLEVRCLEWKANDWFPAVVRSLGFDAVAVQAAGYRGVMRGPAPASVFFSAPAFFGVSQCPLRQPPQYFITTMKTPMPIPQASKVSAAKTGSDMTISQGWNRGETIDLDIVCPVSPCLILD
jgi:hypothetical protein